MTKTVLGYVAPWADVINIVCHEINEEAEKLADLLDSKDIPFEYCVVEGESTYDGKAALVLLGVDGIRDVLNGYVESGYAFTEASAAELIENQAYGHLVVNGVDYVAVSDLFQKLAVLDDFDTFCRNEYDSEQTNFADDDSFPCDEFNETESISDSELNLKSDENNPFKNKTQLMDAAQQAVYRVYEMYEAAIKALFEKDENYDNYDN